MRKREWRNRLAFLERALGDLTNVVAQADFYRQTMEVTLQSQQRDLNLLYKRTDPGPQPGPEPDRQPERKPDPRRDPAGDSNKLLCLHLAKLTRQLEIARDTLALYADEKYWEGSDCPMLRNGAAAHALGEMAAVDVSESTAEGCRNE